MNVGEKAPEILGINEKGEEILLSQSFHGRNWRVDNSYNEVPGYCIY